VAYSFCSDRLKLQAYWWDETPRPEAEDVELPDKTEVLVIGSGYTGLHCGLQTTRAGRDTVIIDAEDAGWGCSTRNGGQIGGEIKPDLDTLCRKYGAEAAYSLIRESRNALDWLGEFVADEHVDCEYQRCEIGRAHV
jgi:glycine/D-amino acid oxidase-like deaminating enzyme